MSHENATVVIKDGVIVITLPVNDPPQASASGKSLVVASTHGNMVTDAIISGKPVIVGVNAYIKR